MPSDSSQNLPRRFLIEDPPDIYPRSVPWSFVEPYEKFAKALHGKTLEQLAADGGLSPWSLLDLIRGADSGNENDGDTIDEQLFTRIAKHVFSSRSPVETEDELLVVIAIRRGVFVRGDYLAEKRNKHPYVSTFMDRKGRPYTFFQGRGREGESQCFLIEEEKDDHMQSDWDEVEKCYRRIAIEPTLCWDDDGTYVRRHAGYPSIRLDPAATRWVEACLIAVGGFAS